MLGNSLDEGKESLLQKENSTEEYFGYFDSRILVVETQPRANLGCNLISFAWKTTSGKSSSLAEI